MRNVPNIPFLDQGQAFLALAGSSSDVVIVADAKRTILFANSTACRKTEYKVKELIGKKISILYRKGDTARYSSKISKGLHESGRWRGEIEMKKKNGATFGVDVAIYQFYDKNGKPAGRIGVGHDLSEQRLLLRHSLESEHEMYNVFESMEDAFCLTDVHGKILMCNSAHSRMLGHPKEEIIGMKPPYPWLDSADTDKFKYALKIARKEHRLKNYHLVWRRKDRSRIMVSLSLSSVQEPSRQIKGFVFTIRDVSELQYVDELQRANERIHRLVLDIKLKGQQLRTLEEVNALVLKNADIPRIFKAITSGIKRLVEHDLAGIYVYDSHRQCFVPHKISKQTPFSRKLGKFPLPLGEGIVGSVAVTGKMVLANNAQNDPRSKYPEGMKPDKEHFIAVPLKGRGPLFGVLVVARNRDPEFIEEESLLVRSFAEAATVALENARLFRQLYELQEQGLTSARVMTTSDRVPTHPSKPKIIHNVFKNLL